ncbi:unnamed protein product [Boreogadus saida]
MLSRRNLFDGGHGRRNPRCPAPQLRASSTTPSVRRLVISEEYGATQSSTGAEHGSCLRPPKAGAPSVSTMRNYMKTLGPNPCSATSETTVSELRQEAKQKSPVQ